MVTFYRRLPKFDYLKPKTLDEALELFKGGRGEMLVYAGGTDVIPRMRARLIPAPDVLVDLKGINDLDYIDYDEEEGLRIGALASISDIASDGMVRERFGILSQAAASIASNQVQHRGTIVGNICSAVPSADAAPALLCLDAKVACRSTCGDRTVDIGEFFTGPRKTILQNDEIVREIQVPPGPAGGRGVYIKLTTRNRMELALVGVGVVVAVSDGLFRDVKIALGAVAPTPIRAKQAEEALRGQKVGEEALAEAGRLAAAEAKPIDDHRASAEYRRLMVETLVKRALGQALTA